MEFSGTVSAAAPFVQDGLRIEILGFSGPLLEINGVRVSCKGGIGTWGEHSVITRLENGKKVSLRITQAEVSRAQHLPPAQHGRGYTQQEVEDVLRTA